MSEVLVILMLLVLSCSLLGNLLVVSNQSPVADALSHSVLLGIVLAFFLVRDLDSPLLTVGATIFGLLTVYGIEWLESKKLAYDAATGLVFTFFFALGVMLISLFARNVHLDLDIVLLGEVLFAPLHRMAFLGFDLPVGLVKSGLVLLVVLIFFALTYRRLAQYLFDSRQAKLVGLNLFWLRLVTMSLVSLTIVTAFDIVGAISVISFLVAPAMIAMFWARHFGSLIGLSAMFGVMMVSIGYHLAVQLDLTVSGTCAFVGFLLFLGNFMLRLWVKRKTIV